MIHPGKVSDQSITQHAHEFRPCGYNAFTSDSCLDFWIKVKSTTSSDGVDHIRRQAGDIKRDFPSFSVFCAQGLGTQALGTDQRLACVAQT